MCQGEEGEFITRGEDGDYLTCITVRGLSDGYQRGKPNSVTHADRIRYVSEHLVLTTLAPTQTERRTNELSER